MTPEALIEAMMRGIVKAVMEVAPSEVPFDDPPPAPRRRARHRKTGPDSAPEVSQQTDLLSGFTSPADLRAEVPPITEADYARLAAMFTEDSPPGTYLPGESEHNGLTR